LVTKYSKLNKWYKDKGKTGLIVIEELWLLSSAYNNKLVIA